MTEDVIRALGYMTLGSRLKRLGDRLQGDVLRLAKAEGIDVPAACFPILAALDRHGPATVGTLAAALGLAQPGVTRNLALLAEAELIESSRPSGDQRQRAVQLSPRGARLARIVTGDLGARVARAVADICAPLTGNLLDQLTAVEAALAARPLDRRAARQTGEWDGD